MKQPNELSVQMNQNVAMQTKNMDSHVFLKSSTAELPPPSGNTHIIAQYDDDDDHDDEEEEDLALLFFSCKGVRPQRILIQPESQSATLGQTVKLFCSRNSGSWYSYFSWFQQNPGEVPRFVGCDSCGTKRGQGIPDRFTASKLGDVGYLTITNLQPKDETDYYCGDAENSGYWTFHSGTV
ncbi:hypothetical protein lerEdw1_010281 [Lerista edwardsae]|nr:hypothetical protein lerEdw1_010281 [Lerista edwardsae]